ncbi:carbamoyltransferase HypF [Gordonibacter massiliensis]|uniref:Carbamoyltransferase HypF n=2 Tax=Gordonibacter massiliensis (ex Traore et al. 2017) TaxID=1841863 RepID=A0A842JAM1_9ACTN|nr:carbamoyltransferase HypF [Gordonibacter massiliensis (ex Traore et al. 2017)]
MPSPCHPERPEDSSCHPERVEPSPCHPERAERVEGSRAAPAAALLADAKRDPSTTALRGSAQDDRDRPCASAQDDKVSIFATGPEQKNTFALTRDVETFVSQHIGDMENAETYDAWLDAKNRYETLFEIRPDLLACDLHPEYLTSKWAREESRTRGLPLVEVQHHHAHVVSVMGEHGLSGPVCGIAFDGTGFGVDGAIWGGEVLISNLRAFERFANFAYVPMPGGAACVKHPLRMAYGALWAFDLLEHPGAADALMALGEQADVCEQMIDRGLNTPMTSSVGRLFDAASALLGVCTEPTYEGEPAILLEAAMTSDACCHPERPEQPSCHPERAEPSPCHPERAERVEGSRAAPAGALLADAKRDPSTTALRASAQDDRDQPCAFAQDDDSSRYAMEVVKNTATAESTAQDTSVVLFDAAPMFKALLDDKAAGVPVPVIARRFHNAFVQAVVMAAELARTVYGIEVVALSGGVFMNRYLVEHALAALERAGFTVAVNRDLPPNDGCISFGQAVVAWASNEEGAAEGGA